MLSMMDFVMANDGVTIGSDLNASQGIAIDIVVFNQPTPLTKDVHPTLVTIVDLILPESPQNKSA